MFQERFYLVFENLVEFLGFRVLKVEFGKLFDALDEEFKLLENLF